MVASQQTITFEVTIMSTTFQAVTLTSRFILVLENDYKCAQICRAMAKQALEVYPNSSHDQLCWLANRLPVALGMDTQVTMGHALALLFDEAMSDISWADIALNFLDDVTND